VLVAGSAVVVGLLPGAASAVNAGPATNAVAQAQQKLDAMAINADRAVEAYNQAQISLAGVTARATAARAAAARQQSAVDVAKVGVQGFAVARYEGGNATPVMAVFLSKSPQAFLTQTQILEQVSRYESASLTKVVNANRALAGLQTSADQAVVAQQKALTQFAASKAAVDKILGEQQTLLGKLQTQATQEQATAAAAATRAATARQQAVSRAASRPKLALAPAIAAPGAARAVAVVAVAPAAAGRASAVLAFAYAQQGKPYRFGGAGMASYDCSGLTMRAYAAAGVSLPHSAAAQQRQGRPVSMSALQPGDLIFWGNPAYHVGIYVGGGSIIDAAHTGTVIGVRGIWGSPSGAVRP
jgi:cell wall-associated NlpC family hydrolase